MQSDDREKGLRWAEDPAQEALVEDWLAVLEAAPTDMADLPPKLADELGHARAALRLALNK